MGVERPGRRAVFFVGLLAALSFDGEETAGNRDGFGAASLVALQPLEERS
jgi:hypothetical protein